jgi:hypothetical protein
MMNPSLGLALAILAVGLLVGGGVLFLAWRAPAGIRRDHGAEIDDLARRLGGRSADGPFLVRVIAPGVEVVFTGDGDGGRVTRILTAAGRSDLPGWADADDIVVELARRNTLLELPG